MIKTIILTVEHKDHAHAVLTNHKGDTFTSKSESLADFLSGCAQATPLAAPLEWRSKGEIKL